jgi:CRISPR-associated protein Csx10
VKIITYRIKLLEPVLVTSLDGDPNSATAFDYLPGSVLRGVMIGEYLRNQSLTPAQFKADDIAARHLFFNGATRYLNGYPVESNRRTLPVPQSWQCEKGQEGEFFDFAVQPTADDEKQWQGISKPFCLLIEPDEDDEDNETQARLIQPEHLITVHTARDRKYGRARTDSGAVYRYESLQAGQTFEAAIICDQDADAATLLPLLTGEATLGGSRSSGYGRVQFTHAQERAVWREVGGTLQPDYNGKLILTLLSDTLVRDVNGQYAVDSHAVTAALSAALGNLPLTLNADRTFLRGAAVGGFNRKWGLPLPQTLAVRMGSVFVYDALTGVANALRTALDTLEKCGIGERRAEGFGRVVVNWQTEEHLKKNETRPPPPPARDINENNSMVIAQRMAKRMLRQRLDAAVTERANPLGEKIKGPKNSQLSRLRLIIHDALRQEPTAGRQRLNEYFNNLFDRQSTRKQFIRDRVAGDTLLGWMRERVTDQASIDICEIERPTIGANVTAELTVELIYEYNLRLIDGVLARAAKERKGEN